MKSTEQLKTLEDIDRLATKKLTSPRPQTAKHGRRNTHADLTNFQDQCYRQAVQDAMKLHEKEQIASSTLHQQRSCERLSQPVERRRRQRFEGENRHLETSPDLHRAIEFMMQSKTDSGAMKTLEPCIDKKVATVRPQSVGRNGRAQQVRTFNGMSARQKLQDMIRSKASNL